MKINEIILEDRVDELGPWFGGPASGLKGLATSALGALGSTTAQAATDVNKRTNEIFQAFKNWALRAGINMKLANVKDINKWLQSQGLPTTNTLGPPQTAYDLTNQTVALDIFKKLAQTAFKAKGATGMGTPLGQQYGLGQGQGGGSGASSINTLITQLASAPLTPNQKQRLKTLLGTP